MNMEDESERRRWVEVEIDGAMNHARGEAFI